MAKEKFIKGKHDDGDHVGKRSNIRRLCEAEEQMELADQIRHALEIVRRPSEYSPEYVAKKVEFLRLYGLG